MTRIGYAKKLALMVMFTTLLLSGCRSSAPPVQFYTLNPITGMQGHINTTESDQKLSIGIGPVEIPASLDRPQIVTRSGPNKLNVDEFHRWAGRLDEGFAQVLAENISLLLGTDQVAVYPWQTNFKPRYRIALKIGYFEGEWGKDVLLIGIWSLTRQQSQQTSIVRKSVIREPLSPGPDYEALVAAQSRAIAQLSREIVKEIQHLQSAF